MKLVVKVLTALCLLGLVANTAMACLWDYDTLQMERQRFPRILELITGKFLRHSPDFYKWRILDRREQLKAKSTPELYDDLAVAYEKIGDHSKAIELMEKKESLFPGLYETRANLGTFYMLNGQFERGVEEIEKAIAINPDAHFGREVYQKHLANYLLAQQAERGLSPTDLPQFPLNTADRGHYRPVGFAGYLIKIQKTKLSDEQEQEELSKALRGVSGMMYFANYDSPLLLEALGDLLLNASLDVDAKQLAARAYLKASYEVKDAEAKAGYRRLAEDCLSLQTSSARDPDRLPLTTLEQTFEGELQDAQAWYRSVAFDEQTWILKAVNVDAAFDQKYYRAPTPIYPVDPVVARTWEKEIATGVGVLFLLIVAWVVWRRIQAARLRGAA